MHEREYKKLLAVIEADYRKKLDALELIYGMANQNGSARNSTSAPVKGKLAQAVVSFVREIATEFNARDLELFLNSTNPDLKAKRVSISNTLKRLEGKEVELIEKGSGKRPSKYRRKNRPG